MTEGNKTDSIPPDVLKQINNGFARSILTWERYRNDPKFKAAVFLMVQWLQHHKSMTADDLREAVEMADSIVESRRLAGELSIQSPL
jgi:hypothetical protein